MPRLLLTLRYDGRGYHGWQVQPNGATVQQRLQDAVEALTGVRSGITGCSRTDAGVHAEMFCCTVDTACALRGDKLCAALNAHLPRDIAVYAAREVPDAFHPRYDAIGKRYVYRLWNGRQRQPFYEGLAWQLTRPLPAEQMHRAAQAYVGRHDFSAFRAAGSDTQGSVRTVRSCSVARSGELVTFSVEADGFLYNMVRIMVGTLTDMAAGRLPFEAIPAILASGERARAGVTAPPYGLYLQEVLYADLDIRG